MFKASQQAKRFEKGQTIEGTLVGIGPEVAFVDVGGKGEAIVDVGRIEELGRRPRCGCRRSHPGDGGVDGGRVDTVSEAGARGDHRSAARRRIPGRSSGGGQGRTGGEGRLRGPNRPPACVLSVLPDRRHPDRGPGGARRVRLHVPNRRVQGRRTEPRRVAPCPPRGGAEGEGSRGPALHRFRRRAARPGCVGARLRRVRRSGRRRAGPAPRVRDGMVARHRRVSRPGGGR